MEVDAEGVWKRVVRGRIIVPFEGEKWLALRKLVSWYSILEVVRIV